MKRNIIVLTVTLSLFFPCRDVTVMLPFYPCPNLAPFILVLTLSRSGDTLAVILPLYHRESVDEVKARVIMQPQTSPFQSINYQFTIKIITIGPQNVSKGGERALNRVLTSRWLILYHLPDHSPVPKHVNAGMIPLEIVDEV